MLLCIPISALQVYYSGRYVVQEKISDQDYIAATPEHKQWSRLCHINMLKPYLDRESVPLCPVSEEGEAALVLSRAEPIDKSVAVLTLSSADPTETQASPALSDDELVEDVIGLPISVVVQGNLTNLEILLLTRLFCI